MALALAEAQPFFVQIDLKLVIPYGHDIYYK